MITSLIDGDIVSYRCAASVNKALRELWDSYSRDIGAMHAGEEVEKEVAILRADKLMRDILEETQATHHRVFLTGSGNFRDELYPLYKKNRVQPKPMFLADVNQFLIDEWDAEVVHGMEADDALGIAYTIETVIDAAYIEPVQTIICSIDKDLLMIPGRHYNFVKKEFYDITEFQGYYNFYKQILTGDRTDNIPGYALGYGPAAAANELMACKTEKELFETVRWRYNDDERLLLNAQLLWIKRDYSTSLGNTSLNELLLSTRGMKNSESNTQSQEVTNH